MKITADKRISEELVNSFDEEAINRPELTSDFIHLFAKEPFDEN